MVSYKKLKKYTNLTPVYKAKIHGHVTSKNVWLFTFNCLTQRLVPENQVRPLLLYFNYTIRKVSLHGATSRSGPGSHHFPGFAITLSHTTLAMTSLDEW